MQISVQNIVLLSLTWLLYFTVHSGLASLSAKRFVAAKWPDFMPYYRLIFNAISLLMLIPPLWFSHSLDGPMLWKWDGAWFFVANALAIIAAIGFYWSLNYYDSSAFAGLRQLREGAKGVEEQEHFVISPLHRFVRHPWYFLGMVIIWTRDMNSAFLVTAVAVSIYFIIGSKLEERKLIVYYGEVYRLYMERVSGLFPLPWRFLSRREAEEVMGKHRLSDGT
ncbi:MAG: hypothetical protein HY786_05400 [Deltaproteobacteria bacterium]|nr:hypothetical protein [Deltaproteobacteria bacterium]